MSDARRLAYAKGAVACFALAAIVDGVMYARTGSRMFGIQAFGFAFVALIWAVVCVRWRREQ